MEHVDDASFTAHLIDVTGVDERGYRQIWLSERFEVSGWSCDLGPLPLGWTLVARTMAN